MRALVKQLDTATRIFSPNIWKNFPFEDPSLACLFSDDFVEHPVTTAITTEAVAWGAYKAYCSTSGSITFATSTGGAVELAETTNNEGAAIKVNALPFNIIRGGGDVWFEARLMLGVTSGTLAVNDCGFFVGLGDAMTLSATVPIAADGTLADENIVGFHCPEGDLLAGVGNIDIVYKANGVTAVTVEAGDSELTEDTYINLGFHFKDDINEICSFYIDNTLIDTKVIPSAAGTDFPNDVQMSPVLALLSGAGAQDVVLTMDWWACAQLL